jgi:hypothetical protein
VSALEHHHYLASRLRLPARYARSSQEASARYGPALKYSSPRPWLLALVISSAMWAGIGWLVWKFV